MQTVFTSGQLTKLVRILEQEGVTHDRFQKVLESGVLGDIFDVAADLEDRAAICEAMDLNPSRRGMLFFDLNWPIDLQELFNKTGCYCPADLENIALATIPEGRMPNLERPLSRAPLMLGKPSAVYATRTHYEGKIFKFPYGTSLRNARRRIRSANWDLAGHEHLLGLLAAYPMGAKPLDPIGENKLIAPATPPTIAYTLAGLGGANRAMKRYIGEEGHYGPPQQMYYLGVREL